MTKNVSIFSMIKFEHDFINQWIEYHLEIGFSHFYLLIDNIFEEQPEYIIDDRYINYITFIKCDKNMFISHFGIDPKIAIELNQLHHFSGYMHQLLNINIIDIIKEDWVTAIGIDQFIYLNGNTIQTYLKNIEKSCDQVIIPWSICASNNKFQPHDNLMKNINNYNCFYGHLGHSNGLIKTTNLKAISSDSHTFITKQSTQNVYIIDEYFTMNGVLNTKMVFDIVINKMNKLKFNDFNIGSVHFTLRNKQEQVIKKYFYWNKINIDELVDNIKNNSYSLSNSQFRIGYGTSIEVYNKLNIPELSCLNTSNYYNYVIELELNKYNISMEQFNKWLTV